MKGKKIFIAETHPVLRDSLKTLIQEQAVFDVVGDSGNGDEVFTSIAELEPDIVVLDISLPGMDGLEVVEQVRRMCANVEFIILNRYDDDEYFREAVSKGAKGYVLKDNAVSELPDALIAVQHGRYFLRPS